ncbi:DTW domain-containing protein 2 isoform X1 [Cynara cardunculus var. scolymus]|uniref:DTW domain-containing protein 2 isoform X1 n=1 Tax=Cynara cardunculus var. scolymus TaxID=59895 RepID=UPI000D62F3A0|nr:DTW domain-containing protein 2 isoform X1 [Cynara cardunculus var. scolymus]
MATTNSATRSPNTPRRICSVCERPATVCLCDSIPAEPLSTATQIVILQHPHEQRHRLATVPVLNKCLRNCQTLIGRRLRRGDSALLDSLHDAAAEENPNQSLHAAFLFPGTDITPSMEINQWKSSFGDVDMNKFVLIAFDGTWKHAKEMVCASFPFLSKFATQVCLTYDLNVDGGTIFSSDLILRKEPFGGCMSTMEAVARCLRILEPNGVEIESKVIGVLRTMVRFQASFLKPTKTRPKLLKKCKD